MMERLFVYGSLQPGGPKEHVLAGLSGDWQPAVVRGKLLEAGWGAELGYPGLVAIDDSGQQIEGWVLASGELGNQWAELDDFEGEEYERVSTTVTLKSGERVEAFVYVLCPSPSA